MDQRRSSDQAVLDWGAADPVRLSDQVILDWAKARLAPFRSAFGATVLVAVILPLLAWIFVYVAAIVITVGVSALDAFPY